MNNASILCDIRKIHYFKEILDKLEHLTKEEFAIVKKHSLDGAKKLNRTVYEKIHLNIAQPYERMKGSGYPYELKENEIFLEARIIGVSDTYEAMAEVRSYRKAFNAQFAFDEIKSLINTPYDRIVVEAFEEVLREEGMVQ